MIGKAYLPMRSQAMWAYGGRRIPQNWANPIPPAYPYGGHEITGTGAYVQQPIGMGGCGCGGCLGADNGNGAAFQQGAIVGRAGMAIGVGISGLLFWWLAGRFGKSQKAGALLGAGLSLGTSALMNRHATGQIAPSAEVIAAHQAWSQPRVEPAANGAVSGW